MENKAEETLSGHREELDVLARELFERETLTEDEIEEILGPLENEEKKKQASNRRR
jgi:ATP-dependent Zn protease